MRKRLYTALACAALAIGAMAQETPFDLSSQRSEVQQVNAVPGQKSEGGRLQLNPTPQHLATNPGVWLSIAKGLQIIDVQQRFANDLQFVPTGKKGARLTIDFGTQAAAKQGVKAKSGAYRLSIGKKGISITGYDERGAFYGIQTLRQLMEGATDGRLCAMEVDDYPTLPNRGVVEGFYGTPWSHRVRLSLIDFYGRHKMNTYLYGPKDDPYHSCPNWRLPYPEKEAADIKELIAACRRNRVDFVWAIHPGQDIKWDDEDYRNLLNKFEWMYRLGVRHFAIFFDDISGEGTNPLRQTELLNRLSDQFVKAKGDVSPLTVCPTDYSRLWANPGERGSLAIYGTTLNPDIKVLWTGDVVCSDLTRETMEWVNTRIQRPAYFWWNFPVTDYARHILMQGPVYGLDTSLTQNDLCGLISNPMEHGEASKLALYGVADYTWNCAAYNPLDNWERALAAMMPQASDAYRTFAIHSCDTESGYRRSESWESSTFDLAHWNEEQAAALEREFEKIEQTPALIEQGCTNAALLSELRPWLAPFGKLGSRGRRTIELGRMSRSAECDDALFWEKYSQNCMSEADRREYEAHKSGTLKLQPFYEEAMEEMGHQFLKKLTGRVPKDYRSIGSYANSRSSAGRLMLDGDSSSHYSSGAGQREGDYIGVDLRDVRQVRDIFVAQGRNSTDDTDYYDHATLECSVDGESWTTLVGEIENRYQIHWQGAAVKARYVRLRRLESRRTHYATVRIFAVNRQSVYELGFKVEGDDAQNAIRAFDENVGTHFSLAGSLSIELPHGTKSCTLLMSRPADPIVCRLTDAQGQQLVESSLSDAFAKIECAQGAAQLTLTGNATLYEVVFE